MFRSQALLTLTELDQIKNELRKTNPRLLVEGLEDMKLREEAKEVIKKSNSLQKITRNDPEKLDYAVREIIGAGIIEEILENDESITDIKFNSNGHFILKSNDKKVIYDGVLDINARYIQKLAEKFASVNRGKSFTPKNAILNGKFGSVRVNNVHGANEVNGNPTMALRVTRPTLPLNEENFEEFAPNFVLDFFEKLVSVGENITLSGSTGAGKSSFQKLLFKFVLWNQTLAVIESTPELHLTELFPDKDILSWVTSDNVSEIDLITQAGMRNDIFWIALAEVLDSEAYSLFQAALTGHYIITTVHSKSAIFQPERFVYMMKRVFDIDEQELRKLVREVLGIGIHLEHTEYKGKRIRYLAEIVGFDPQGDIMMFKQYFNKLEGKFIGETGIVPDSIKEKFANEGIVFSFPENYKFSRYVSNANIIEQIPIKR